MLNISREIKLINDTVLDDDKVSTVLGNSLVPSDINNKPDSRESYSKYKKIPSKCM